MDAPSLSKASSSPWRWYWHRLRAMDVAEVAGRIGQKVRLKLDRQAPPGSDFELEIPSTDQHPLLPRRDQAPEALRRGLAGEAARLLAGHWKLFGWREVVVGTPPQWQRDPVNGVSVRDVPKLNHRRLPHGADARSIWEINRWCEMVRLAMHAWLNGDRLALETSQSWLEDWTQSNPVGQGINWSSPLEAGLRLINFTWFDALARAAIAELPNDETSRALAKRQQALTQAIVPTHAWWLQRRLSLGSSANNHLLGELAGLLVARRRWPALEKLGHSTERLQQALEKCVFAQFAPDGGNREQALHYHLFAWEMILHASRAIQLSQPALRRWREAGVFLARVAQTSEPWDYGDNDDAQIVPLPSAREHAATEWRAWITGEPEGESLCYWLGEAPFTEARAKAPGVWLAPESGIAVAREAGWMARLDASPLGFGKMAAHGHCDALHLSLWDGDEALIIDPGTGGYFAAPELRAELADWLAHNGPQPLASFRTPSRHGTFLLAEHHAVPQLHCLAGRMEARLAHEGFEFLRTVTFENQAVIIEDQERQSRPFRTRWYLAPECALANEGSTLTVRRDAKIWRVQPAGDVTIEQHTAQASPAYGEIVTCRVLEIHSRGPLRIVWTRV